MIQDYEINNGKVTAYDNNKGFITYECQNNIEDILIQENVIEKITDDITAIKINQEEKETHLNNKFNKKRNIISIILGNIFIIALCFVTFYNVASLAITLSIIGSIIFNGGLFLLDLESKNELKNKINSNTLQIEQLEELLEEEKIKLKELKLDNKNDNYFGKSSDFKEKNKTKLEKIDELKNIYRICGYYAKNLIKYQEKGILKDKLDDSFTNEELSMIENLVIKKCPQLIKRKTANK